jgi:hypothetical protein
MSQRFEELNSVLPIDCVSHEGCVIPKNIAYYAATKEKRLKVSGTLKLG